MLYAVQLKAVEIAKSLGISMGLMMSILKCQMAITLMPSCIYQKFPTDF